MQCLKNGTEILLQFDVLDISMIAEYVLDRKQIAGYSLIDMHIAIITSKITYFLKMF